MKQSHLGEGRGDPGISPVLARSPQGLQWRERSLSVNQYGAPNRKEIEPRLRRSPPGPHEGKGCRPGTWTLLEVGSKRRAEGQSLEKGHSWGRKEPLTSPPPSRPPRHTYTDTPVPGGGLPHRARSESQQVRVGSQGSQHLSQRAPGLPRGISLAPWG